ncbi:DUF5050 domain-containing protein [Desulfosporosinus nitroreducens]|uniref:DUF5050 domain-containing protein n=2 Tax=Desulfosporosinus nitroreducens TaxID=2018668 RepID=A0ABT8QR92_9FIRM|nr:DUF5050 domain-containing protein [Desulfosporosinus nitroreducens]MDO0823873.1 DUF5050 domain-containing protein [Desulfosporosinus nitroreducens]
MGENKHQKQSPKIQTGIIGMVLTLSIILGVGCTKFPVTEENGQKPHDNIRGNTIPVAQENVENLQGNILGNLVIRNSMVAEKGNTHYFIYYIAGSSDESTGLYSQELDDTLAKTLVTNESSIVLPQVSGDFVYYLSSGKGLCRINTKAREAKEEVVAPSAGRYSIYDHWAYFWKGAEDSLYYMDLTDIKNPPQKIAEFPDSDLDFLAARGDFILAVARLGNPQQRNMSTQIWKLSPDGEKKELLTATPNWPDTDIQPYKNHIYYYQDNAIWRTNLEGENKEQVYTSNNSISEFIIYADRIYLVEGNEHDPHMYISVDLEGKDKRLIFNLRGPKGNLGEDKSKINSIFDEMHIQRFNVTREYLYLTGAGYNSGQIWLSRIPIAGAAEEKKAETLVGWRWRSVDYFIQKQ